MQTQLVTLVADEHCSIRSQPASESGIHTELYKPRAQLVSITRSRFELERELLSIAIEPEQPL
jgi:hypothetical protein